MPPHRYERRNHFRGKSRPDRGLPVRFRDVGETAWVAAEARNIGVGGAFIASPQVEPVDTPVTLELSLPSSDQVFQLLSVVRWTSGDGMGVEFVDLDAAVLLELTDYFATLTFEP